MREMDCGDCRTAVVGIGADLKVLKAAKEGSLSIIIKPSESSINIS